MLYEFGTASAIGKAAAAGRGEAKFASHLRSAPHGLSQFGSFACHGLRACSLRLKG